MEIQHSIEWFRKRLGNFTGSQIGLLMKKGRSDYFSDTAKTYIYQVASERDMNPEIINDDVEFEKYLHQVCVNTKAMYNPQIEMFARFKMKSSFHKTKRII